MTVVAASYSNMEMWHHRVNSSFPNHFISPLRILSMHSLYFDYICPPLFLTPPSSTTFHLASSFLFCYYNPPVLFPLPFYSWCWASHWRIGNLPGATPLKTTNSPSPRSHELPLAPQPGVGAHDGHPSPCRNVDRLDLVWATTSTVSLWVSGPVMSRRCCFDPISLTSVFYHLSLPCSMMACEPSRVRWAVLIDKHLG